MVRNAKNIKDLTKASVSFIPSLKCNNKCTFCMYQAGPDMDIQLNLDDAKHFVDTVDWDRICGWGFYGGEPSIEMDLYQQFYDLIPEEVPKFIITNGSWSKSEYDTGKFLHWCRNLNKFDIYISSCTNEHRAQQDMDVISTLSQYEGIHVRFEEEELLPMGRNFRGEEIIKCTEKCVWHKQPIRLGLFPTGNVILQNCDGAYPVVSHIHEGFTVAFNQAAEIRKEGLYECKWLLPHLNDVLKGIKY